MTLQEFNYAYYAYYNKLDQEYKSNWERTRWLSLSIINYVSMAKKRPDQNTAGFKFPWDKKQGPSWKGKFKTFEDYKKWLQSAPVFSKNKKKK